MALFLLLLLFVFLLVVLLQVSPLLLRQRHWRGRVAVAQLKDGRRTTPRRRRTEERQSAWMERRRADVEQVLMMVHLLRRRVQMIDQVNPSAVSASVFIFMEGNVHTAKMTGDNDRQR